MKKFFMTMFLLLANISLISAGETLVDPIDTLIDSAADAAIDSAPNVRYNTPTFRIENDTNYKTTLFACNAEYSQEITVNNSFTMNKPLYVNYKPVGLAFATRYKFVNSENNFKLKVETENKIFEFIIKVTNNLKENSTLKISDLLDFEIQI